MPVFHTKVIEGILEPVAQQSFYSIGEANFHNQHQASTSHSSLVANGRQSSYSPPSQLTTTREVREIDEDFPNRPFPLSRSTSKKSFQEWMGNAKQKIYSSEDCPICQILLPKRVLGAEGTLNDCVSRLVILHEEAEDGNAMPDLTKPVGAVSRAVDNLIKVGYDTCHSSDDKILQQDMPPALQRVEVSSRLLEEACHLLKGDPYSSPARKKVRGLPAPHKRHPKPGKIQMIVVNEQTNFYFQKVNNSVLNPR
uniref:Vinculin n=1 Tax=Ditylenchus dipsaci TaxID=166011 RepID=A0A915CWJ3_9BILA